MNTLIKNNIVITNPTTEVKEWVKNNLVLNNPEYANKVRLGLWVGNTPRKLYLYKEIGNELILPYGVLKEIYHLLEVGDIGVAHKEQPKVFYDGNIGLYDYQEKAVENAYKGSYGIITARPGAGKTQIALGLIQKLGKRTLWLTHTKDLLNQSKGRAEQFFDKKIMGTITNGKVQVGKGITFATVQTLVTQDLTDIKDYFDVLIVDECHRISGTPTKMTQFYKVINSINAKHKYGLTATLHRADGMVRATTALIGDVVHEVPVEVVENKLMQVGIRPIETSFRINDKCLNTDGTFSYSRTLAEMTRDIHRNSIITSYLKLEKDNNILVLSNRVQHLKDLRNMLPPDLRSKSKVIDGKTNMTIRDEVMEQMRKGELKILFASYNLAKEGLDIPILNRLFLTTPVKDYAITTQAVGRIARTHKDKDDAIVYDFVDNGRYFSKLYNKRLRHYKKLDCYLEE